MTAPNGFPGIRAVDQHHVGRPVVDAERAGYETLATDRREAMERYQRQAARARRVTERANELAAMLANNTMLLALAVQDPYASRRMPVTYNEALSAARALLAQLEGGDSGDE